jgi:amidase
VSADLESAGASELARAVAAREVSAVELCEACIDRIEARNPAVNAVVVKDYDRALDAARLADAAVARGETGPLLGVPMTVKEAFNVEGLVTTWGLESARDWIAPEDAEVVKRLKAAGAVIVGKTNVPPNLGDWQSANPVYGRTVNPHDATRSPGGSSGGSAAALATGMVPLEFGSDIGGSIRVPSAFCGTVGHKPSFGLVPIEGHAPPGAVGNPPPLGVVGPMARRVEDLELALQVTAGPAGMDAVGYRLDLPSPRADRLEDFRVLVLDDHPAAPVDAEIRAAIQGVARRLRAAGADVAEHSNRLPDIAAQHATYMPLLMTAMSHGGPPSPQTPSAHAFMDLQNAQLAWRRRWAELFESFDVVLAPTLGTVAFPHIEGGDWADRTLTIDGQPQPFSGQLLWASIATLPNLPSTAVPIGKTRGALPIGAQVLGPYLEDRTTLAFARLLLDA